MKFDGIARGANMGTEKRKTENKNKGCYITI